MMKKIIPFIMAVFIGIPLLAQQSVVLGDVDDAVPGEIIEIPLNMYDFTNVGAITLNIAYDGNLLGFSGFIPNIQGIPAPIVNLSEEQDNRLILQWNYLPGTDIDEKFGTFTFEYKGFFSGTLDFIVASCEITDNVGDAAVYNVTYMNASVSQDPNLVPDGKASIGNASAIAGANVMVPVSLNDLGGFNDVAKALDIRVGYDNTKLTFKGIENVHPGFEVDDITSGGFLIITNPDLPEGFDFDGSTLFNLEFQYFGGGSAAVDFLPGSIITDQFANILVTDFNSGGVDQHFDDEHGSLSIEKKTTEGATMDDFFGNPQLVPDPVTLNIEAEGLDDINDMGLVHLVIAYDTEKLQFTGPMTAPDWSIESGTPGLLTLEKYDITGFTINDGVLFTLEFDYLFVSDDETDGPQTNFPDSQANVEFQVGTYLLKTDATPVGPELIDGWVSLVVSGPPPYANLQDFIAQQGEDVCFDATQKITTGGSNTYFIVKEGGSVSLIAGESIRMLPGTVVEYGGYLHAHITLDGEYCGAPVAKLLEEPVDEPLAEQIVPAMTDRDALFKVYPNPTIGAFTLELTDEFAVKQVTVEVYGLRGERILSEDLVNQQKHTFTLENQLPGIYIIRVTAGERTDHLRILKR
jgi:hypothetical protein